MSTMAVPQPTASEAAVRYLITNYSPKGNKVGWLMMASILVEAWDLYSIAFVLIFIREQYNPDPLMLGLAAAGTQGGATLAQQTLDVQRLIAMREAGAIGRKTDDEALHVTAQGQQHALAREINRRNVQAVARTDDDERIGGETIDGVMHRRAAEAGDLLQFQHGHELAGLELAMNEQLLDLLIGQLEEVETVAPRGLALAVVVVSHHRERALAPCHVCLPPACALVAGRRLICGTLKTCCDILQASVRLSRTRYMLQRKMKTRRCEAPVTGGQLP